MSFIMRPIRFAPTGHITEGSGLFNGSSGYLFRTQGTPTNRRVWSVEFIVKHTLIDSYSYYFGTTQVSAGSFWLNAASTGVIDIRSNTSGGIHWRLTTTQVFRDPSAFSHILYVFDSTQATANDRQKLYINGTKVTTFTTQTDPSLNYDPVHIASGVGMQIGHLPEDSSKYNPNYFSRAAFYDGQALVGTDVGEVTDDGFWQINSASDLDFGDNGFLLEGGTNISDGVDTLATGKDDVRDIGDSVTKWNGNTGSYSYAQGAGNEIRATTSDDGIYSSHVFKGDFDFDIDEYDATNGLLGVFASNEVDTFAGADTNGNLDAMTNSFWIQRATGGAANLAYVGGSSEGVTLSHTDGANYRFERRSGTITLYKNDASLRVFSATYTGNMVAFIGNGNTGFEAIDVTITDKAGGNNFAATGTITATNDSPTNDADDGYGNYATFNPLEPSSWGGDGTFSNGNLTAAITGAGGDFFRSTFTVPTTGKWYAEFLVDSGSGGNVTYGLVDHVGDPSGTGQARIVVATDGDKYSSDVASWESYGTAFSAGTVMGLAVDMDNGAIYFAEANTWMNSGDPESGASKTGAAFTDLLTATISGDWYMSVYCGTSTQWTADFGQNGFTYTPPTGYSAIATQNLPEPAVINYEDEYYIEAGISHTNGSTTAVTLPKTVSGGAMVRIKRTDSTGDWIMFDTVRGVNKSKDWNQAEAEDTSTFDDQNLTGTTFTMPSDLPSGTYLLECFYVGSYFQIQTFTGNAAARTITWPTEMDSYGFSAFFPRTGASSGISHHKNIGAQQILFLDGTGAAADRTNFSQAPDKTDFRTPASVGPDFNLNTIPYVCYGWANSGPYAWGSYIGNGNADGPAIPINSSPQTMLFKANTSADWVLLSQSVGSYNPKFGDDTLNLNLTSAIHDGSSDVDVLSTGIKVRNANTDTNNSSAIYYGAFGIQPLTDGGINQGRAK